MTDRLAVTTFSPAVGTAFLVETGAGSVELRLVSAEVRDSAPRGPDGWTPFNLFFVGPVDPVLEQRTHRLRHETVGTHDVFLVPIGRDTEGTRYEAVFG